MAQVKGEAATIGGEVTLERRARRVLRLKKSLSRATGPRKASLEAELAGHMEQLKGAADVYEMLTRKTDDADAAE